MRVSVILNTKAGSTEVAQAEKQIRSALFRCELEISKPQNETELKNFLEDQLKKKSDFLILVGGDGTINFFLQQIRILGLSFEELPPIALVSGGTANDLAFELGVSKNIEKAVRLVLNGKIQNIDVIQIKDHLGQARYMVTNGGIGLPAVAADYANRMRAWMKERSVCSRMPRLGRSMAHLGGLGLRRLGQKIYTLTAISAITTWQQNEWELQLESAHFGCITTRAPIVFINNQSTLGGSFKTSNTYNSDGAFNILLAEAPTKIRQVKTLLDLRHGLTGLEASHKSFEVDSVQIRSLQKDKKITFFGDGEILLREAESLEIRCLASSLKMMVAPL